MVMEPISIAIGSGYLVFGGYLLAASIRRGHRR
jgi:hypothetical protein